MNIKNSKKRLLDSEQELSYSQRIAIYDLIEQLEAEKEAIYKCANCGVYMNCTKCVNYNGKYEISPFKDNNYQEANV